MSIRFALAVLAMSIAATGQAQQLRTYTQSQVGPTFLTYGLPVPEPIESLTPVDGFRSYASLEARLQSLALSSPDLSAHDVGPTLQGRALWAYVVSDENGVDVEGRPEAAFFINANTHAREWAAPEVSTGTVERLVELADDGGINRYLLDNTRLVIIPVHNVDGLLQTQRFPTQVLVGSDPDFPNDWPRDGRMRRKNMRGVDEVLTTLGDHLNGVDLNRNHPPFWATSPSSSNNPSSLLFHGGGAHSEPENQALLRAAELGPATRIRLGIDVHSHSAVYFSVNTARTRLNNIQNRLIGNLIGHHAQAAGRPYTNVPEPPNRGIGTAAEYFAYQWLVPAWTLELEPSDGASEYGGTNVTHGGFILPASQVRRVREGWAQTHAIAFYMMAGPPHLARLRVVDVGTGVLALESRWVYNPASGLRERMTTVPGPLIPSRRYRAELAFNKPMRYREPGGAVARLPGRELSDIEVGAALLRGTTTLPLDTSAGQWLTDPARTLRYRDDTFAFEFNAPAEQGDVRFEFELADMTGLPLDADPASPADWASGAWSEYENANGADGDFGGADRSMQVSVSQQAAAQVSVQADVSIVGEGDRVKIRATRAAGSGRLELRRLDRTPPQTLATWEAGETGLREFLLQTTENLSVDGDRPEQFLLSELVDGVPAGATSISLPVLDNDRPERRAWNLPRAESLQSGWSTVSSSVTPVDVVLHSDGEYAVTLDAVGAVPGGLAAALSDIVLFGNHASVSASGGVDRASLLRVSAGRSLQIDDLDLQFDELPGAAATDVGAFIDNAGTLRVSRSSVAVNDGRRLNGPLLRNRGVLSIERSGLAAATRAPLLQQLAGSTTLLGSTVYAGDNLATTPLAVDVVAGSVSLSSSSLLGGVPLVRVPAGNPIRSLSSLIMEILANTGTVPPEFVREPCASPLIAGEGWNTFSPVYPGGDSNAFATTGCATLHPTDVSRTTALPGTASGDEPRVRFTPPPSLRDVGSPDDCGIVDQRGAPRPQSSTASAPLRCDIGAVEIGINPYRGIWAPERSGHGMELEVSGNRLLLVWYTYGDDGQPTVYQAVAPLTGPNWSATLQRSARNVQTGQVTLSNVGTVGIDFDNDVVATLRWRFASRGIDGSERIRASLFGIGEPRVEVTGLWYPPADSGYGATIGRRGETTAAAIYYYDALGNIRWALGSGNGGDAIEFSMASFTGFCPDCNASANPPVGTAAGRLMVHFLTPRRARMDMELTYPRGVGGTWNRDRASFVPLSDPVDNREAVAQFPN